MRLRKLEQRDAERMLAWMHDRTVVERLQTDFTAKTLKDCKDFIESSQDAENIHFAIVDDEDTYMGTVSLKHIRNETAEFAIVICKAAMGKGYSIRAMDEILKIGFERYSLKDIYWCVAPDNLRALRFYDKNKFQRVSADEITITGGYTKEQINSYVWFHVKKIQERGTGSGKEDRSHQESDVRRNVCRS